MAVVCGMIGPFFTSPRQWRPPRIGLDGPPDFAAGWGSCRFHPPVGGPPKCSVLHVVRFDEQSLVEQLIEEFLLRQVHCQTHIIPWQSEQRFI